MAQAIREKYREAPEKIPKAWDKCPRAWDNDAEAL